MDRALRALRESHPSFLCFWKRVKQAPAYFIAGSGLIHSTLFLAFFVMKVTKENARMHVARSQLRMAVLAGI